MIAGTDTEVFTITRNQIFARHHSAPEILLEEYPHHQVSGSKKGQPRQFRNVRKLEVVLSGSDEQ